MAMAASSLSSSRVCYYYLVFSILLLSSALQNSSASVFRRHRLEAPPVSARLLPRADVFPPNASLAQRLACLADHDSKRITSLNTQIDAAIVARGGSGNSTAGGGRFASGAVFHVSAGPGIFTMELTLGTPATTYPLIMDTGSQLVWMQCSPCDACISQRTPIFSPAQSKTYANAACTSDACRNLPGQCAAGKCNYRYSYASQANTQGILSTDTLSFPSSAADGLPQSFSGVVFGCGYTNHGDYGGAAGLVGMGQSPLSLPSQLGPSIGGRRFSYCLQAQAASTGGAVSSTVSATTLLLGASAAPVSGMVYTPIVVNPAVSPSLYYINLAGFSVDSQMLDIPAATFGIDAQGGGGMILDSGTTYTYLPTSAFQVIRQAFDYQLLRKFSAYKGHPFLPACYSIGAAAFSFQPPSLTVHLQGAHLTLPYRNYFIPVDNQNNFCLAFIPTTGGLQILGNLVHQNFYVLYDLDNSRIGFAAQPCN